MDCSHSPEIQRHHQLLDDDDHHHGDSVNTSLAEAAAVSINDLLRRHCRERLLVPPLQWTSRHLDLLGCSFANGPSPHTNQGQLSIASSDGGQNDATSDEGWSWFRPGGGEDGENQDQDLIQLARIVACQRDAVRRQMSMRILLGRLSPLQPDFQRSVVCRLSSDASPSPRFFLIWSLTSSRWNETDHPSSSSTTTDASVPRFHVSSLAGLVSHHRNINPPVPIPVPNSHSFQRLPGSTGARTSPAFAKQSSPSLGGDTGGETCRSLHSARPNFAELPPPTPSAIHTSLRCCLLWLRPRRNGRTCTPRDQTQQRVMRLFL